MSTTLYNVLSGLHYSDILLSTTITTLSGKLSPAFTADKLTIGQANGITASNYSLPVNDQVVSGSFGTADNIVASEKNVKTYVEGKIAEANGAAISGATFNDAISGTVTDYDGGKHIAIGVKVDNKTVKVNGGVLSAALTLSSVTAGSGYASAYELIDAGGTSHGRIDIPKDQFLKDAAFGYATDATGAGWKSGRDDSHTNPVLKLTFDISKGADGGQTATEASDTDKVVYVDLTGLIAVYQAGNGINITNDKISLDLTAVSGVAFDGNKTISAQINTTANDGFLKNSANGLYTSGILDAITAATNKAVSADTEFATASGILIATGAGRKAQDSKVTIETSLTNSDSKVPTSKAVSSHVSTVTTKMVTADADLTSGKLVLGDGSKKVKASTYQISGILGDVATDIPTSKAVSSFVDTKIQTANEKNVTADAAWGTGNGDKLVVTDGIERKIKLSSYSVSTAKITGNSDATIPTNTAILATLADYVKGPTSATDGHIAQFDGATGKLIKGGKAFTDNAVTSTASGNTSVPTNAAIWKTVSGLVSGTVATVTANDFAMFDGTNGRALKDSTVSLQKSTDTNGTTLSADTKIPTAKAISGYIAAQTANYVVPSGSGFALDGIAIFADDSGKKIATSNKSFSTAVIASDSTDAQIPTAKAVWSTVSGTVTNAVTTSETNWTNNSEIIVTAGSKAAKKSGKTIVESTAATNTTGITDSSDDTKIPTAGAVAEYVTDGLDALYTQIDHLNDAIAELN